MNSIPNKFSSLENVKREFDLAAKFLSLSGDQMNFIAGPRFSANMKLPVRMDNGKIKVFNAHHAIHSIIRGPAIGGVQFRTNLGLDMVEALAFWSTHRCALMDIPFGGSCGLVECDPSIYSIGEMERISRRYVAELANLINPENDILTADIGTNQQIMCWMMDTYSAHAGIYSPAVALGKPVDLGGSEFSIYPTAVGANYCIKRACESLGLDIKNSSVAIQGFGKVGMNLCGLLDSCGSKIVAVGDISGSYYNERGLNVKEVLWHQQSNGILDGVESESELQKMSSPDDILELPADVLVLAAVENQITDQNMFDIKAKIIAEVAHDPVSPLADRYLYEKGVLIIPDILCNSGGVLGYYLEWIQNRSGYLWDAKRADFEIQKIIECVFDKTQDTASSYSISMRSAAAINAVRNIVNASELRGVYA